jgi:membrane-bound lytic murein transglycosylase F
LLRKAIFILACLITVLFSCSDFHRSSKKVIGNVVSFDLDSIRKRGKLIAVTDFNSTNYFIYKGEPMGFNYELLKSFSDNVGIDLEIIAENQIDRSFGMLKSGEADLVACGLIVDSSRVKDVGLSLPIYETRQVLVQRKPHDWRLLSEKTIENKLIRDHHGLSGKLIYVPTGSPHARQLISLAREIGDSIKILEVPFESEKLIQHVVKGGIEYTVCDENLAMVNATYYPDIDVRTTLSFPQDVKWAVRRSNSEKLLSELNRWIASYKKTESYALLYAKYFKNASSSMMVRSDYYALNTGKVSQYDDLIRKFSANIDWDWRLLASLICQESHFNPNVQSYSGAFGLMQIMPDTGRNFGIDIASSPENNLKAGILYIHWLHSIFDPKIPDPKERLNFILASYNAGPGHVIDAMKLAEKNGMNPLKWEGNVALWLLKKSEPQYYNDTVVKNGCYWGTESVNFVSQVLARFEHYKNIIPEEKSQPF